MLYISENPSLAMHFAENLKVELVLADQNIYKWAYTDPSNSFVYTIYIFPDILTLIEFTITNPKYLELLAQVTIGQNVVYKLRPNPKQPLDPNGYLYCCVKPQQADFALADQNMTVLDCMCENQLEILKFGALDVAELTTSLFPQIQLRYSTGLQFELAEFEMVAEKNDFKSQNYQLLVGTKEKLKEVLNLPLPNYFLATEINGIKIINLGSQINLQAIARNLHTRIQIAQSYCQLSKAFIWQNWGSSFWGQRISTHLHDLSIPTSNSALGQENLLTDTPDNINILENITKPALA